MAASKKLFGTDGVRGVAGEFLTAELALALGAAATRECEAPRPQVLVLRDTRESGPMFESAIASGIAQAGGDAIVAGVLPTPGASILVRRLGLDLAAVISASHNPWYDNGIKFFGADGRKLDAAAEARIEELVLTGATTQGEHPGNEHGVGTVRELHGGLDDYLRELERAFDLDLTGKRVVLDCANGSTHRAAPAIFARLGADIELIATEPDGRNINAECGSTHPEALAERVVSSGASIGFAFDGDGDRVIAVDSAGTVRDGDEVIALAALHLAGADRLGGGVAVTVMSNYGFHNAMGAAGIEVATTAVGDRNVTAEMDARRWTLGGEQSGHVIWTEFAPTGDGIAAALLTLAALGDGELAAARPMARLPQVLVNVEVVDRELAAGSSELAAAVESESAALEGRGRVLVRPSGTEPLIRVMVEAPDESEAEAVCGRLAAIAKRSGAEPRRR
jgi:phosphoglucosamine mutase